jgi:uncharacterized protein with GYD domain
VGKYMFIANYNAEGVSGVLHTGGTARVDAISEAAKSLGGKLETFYFGFGGEDAYVIVDLPDNTAAAALAMTASASGVVGVRTVVLVTPGEVDDASKKQVAYRAAGR